MSSILTNQSAATALRTLQGTNARLALTQDRVSTGLKVASAKDNAAVWTVSSRFRIDAASTRVVADGLGVGLSNLALSRGTAERVVEILDKAYGKALARIEMQANGDPNAATMAREIGALGDSISTLLSNTSFNGVNLLTPADSGSGTAAQELWYHFQWTDAGGVVTANDWKRYDTTSHEWVVAGGPPAVLASTDMTTLIPEENIGAERRIEGFVAFDGSNWVGHQTASSQTWAAASNPFGIDIDWSGATGWPATNGAGPITLAPASGGGGAASDASFVVDVSGGTFTVTNANLNINITSASSFAEIENALAAARQAAANLGAAEQRLEAQRGFAQSYQTALERGLGAMVDADMTEESARLQAMQVKQQLGSQAMAIANQAPNILLQLF